MDNRISPWSINRFHTELKSFQPNIQGAHGKDQHFILFFLILLIGFPSPTVWSVQCSKIRRRNNEWWGAPLKSLVKFNLYDNPRGANLWGRDEGCPHLLHEPSVATAAAAIGLRKRRQQQEEEQQHRKQTRGRRRRVKMCQGLPHGWG
jgi:hypothetical protein